MMTVGPGERLHMRSYGSPISLGAIWLRSRSSPLRRALTGAAFAISSTAGSWRLRPATGRHLRHLHSIVIRLVERRSNTLVDGEAAHGPERQ
jgi:hypothetical protein